VGCARAFWSEKSTIGKVFFGVAKYLAGLLNSWQTLWVCVCVCLGQNEVVCRFNFAGESGRHEELFQYPLSLDVDAQLGNVPVQFNDIKDLISFLFQNNIPII